MRHLGKGWIDLGTVTDEGVTARKITHDLWETYEGKPAQVVMVADPPEGSRPDILLDNLSDSDTKCIFLIGGQPLYLRRLQEDPKLLHDVHSCILARHFALSIKPDRHLSHEIYELLRLAFFNEVDKINQAAGDQ